MTVRPYEPPGLTCLKYGHTTVSLLDILDADGRLAFESSHDYRVRCDDDLDEYALEAIQTYQDPVEFLQAVDIAVEIPQYGVIRSLNVHVSTAIAIWEMSKSNFREESK